MMLEECVAYFKARPEFERVFIQMKKQWLSYGKTAGYIVIKKPSGGEKQVLGRFLHRDFSHPRDLAQIKFKMAAFEQALAITKYASLELKEIIAAYFGIELVATKEQTTKQQNARNVFFQELLLKIENKDVQVWLAQAWENKNNGYLLLGALFKEDPRLVQTTIQAIDQTVAYLADNPSPLAVLAAGVTGNPHYFDRNVQPGRLLLYFLAWRHGVPVPRRAQAVLELYAAANISPDDISSSVVVKNIDLYRAGKKHLGIAGFNELNEPCVVTLGNLAGVEKARSKPYLFVFENQMVFSYLANEKMANCSLMCTSGQLKVAALKLLELIEPDVEIYYSGDFDPEGLQICDKILGRFKNAVPWGFSEKMYLQAISNQTISPIRLAKLDSLKDRRLMDLAQAIKTKQKAGYQENILDFYLEEMVRITTKKEI